jgi:hypothetical protein
MAAGYLLSMMYPPPGQLWFSELPGINNVMICNEYLLK